MAAHTSCASAAEAVLPVPIAHTGSYAMTVEANCAVVRPSSEPLSWFTTKSTWSPASRTSNFSPTQTIGVRP